MWFPSFWVIGSRGTNTKPVTFTILGQIRENTRNCGEEPLPISRSYALPPVRSLEPKPPSADILTRTFQGRKNRRKTGQRQATAFAMGRASGAVYLRGEREREIRRERTDARTHLNLTFISAAATTRTYYTQISIHAILRLLLSVSVITAKKKKKEEESRRKGSLDWTGVSNLPPFLVTYLHLLPHTR